MLLLKQLVQHHNGTKLLTSVLIWKKTFVNRKKLTIFFIFLIKHIWICLFHCYFWYYIRFSKSFSTSNLNINGKFLRTKLSFMKWHQPVFIKVKFFQSWKVESGSISSSDSLESCCYTGHLSLMERWTLLLPRIIVSSEEMICFCWIES